MIDRATGYPHSNSPAGCTCSSAGGSRNSRRSTDRTETTLTETTLQRQFARTPYAVSFESQGITFTLVTLHVLWGKNAQDRLPEIKEIARWLRDWSDGGDEFGENLMALGDFNIDRKDDPLYQAFIATGLRPPTELESLPRTIFQDPDEGHFTTRSPGSSTPAARRG